MIARALVVAVVLASLAGAQSIRAALWGFDGRVVPDRFNLLQVFVDNPTADPLDTQLILTRQSTLGAQLGAPIVVPCYLAPRSQRWLQFVPFVTDRLQPWHVRFANDTLAGFDVPRPAAGPPALVLLETRKLDSSLSYVVALFPADQFPTTLAATHGLGAVVVDTIPDWEASRRRTFHDWVRAGGTVHLLRGFRGWPTFGGDLAELDGPDEVTRVGDGVVVKQPFDRALLRERVPDELAVRPIEATDVTQVHGSLRDESLILRSWVMINVFAFAYVAFVGIGVLAVARRTGSWVRTLGALALVVGVASFGFVIAGRTSTEDTARILSLTHARPLGDDRWWTTRIASAFVTRGGEYTFAADGTDDAFSTAQVFEAVRGEIRQGADAHLVADIPPTSWRGYVHDRVMRAGEVQVVPVVGPWRPGGMLPHFRFMVAPDAPIRDVRGALCVWGDDTWVLTPHEGRLLATGPARPLADALRDTGRFGWCGPIDATLALTAAVGWAPTTLPPSHALVLLVGTAQAGVLGEQPDFAVQTGAVVLHLEIPVEVTGR